ncbi:MAG: nucleotide exchange factor GrpE [Spirochaetaceae bacterium]|jgi:molecular chaperone GrpE|nr:nucleotide exchange factor GrpE [Spirochaetaceae bacterium]
MSTEQSTPYDEVYPHPEPVEDASKVASDPLISEVEESELEEPLKNLSEGEKLRDAQGQIAELKDQYLRKAAEFENFRKRMSREKQDAIDFANQSLLLDLIPIIDDFERAVKAAEASQKTAGDFTAFYEGISMIEKRLSSQLENKWGLKRFDSTGEPFDPNRHEAIMMEKSPDISEPVVKEDFIKGYILKDRLVRSAKVKVLMPESSGAEREGERSETEEKGPSREPLA